MRILSYSLFFVALAGRAAESCPWMNAGTAGGLLDTTVEATVMHPQGNKEDASCNFVSLKGLARELRIEVRTTKATPKELEQCTAKPVALKAIGNEASACSVESKNGGLIEQVAGRVRNRVFVIRIYANATWSTAAALREKSRSAAETVAGNLF
jgi:hypothetical protein